MIVDGYLHKIQSDEGMLWVKVEPISAVGDASKDESANARLSAIPTWL